MPRVRVMARVAFALAGMVLAPKPAAAERTTPRQGLREEPCSSGGDCYSRGWQLFDGRDGTPLGDRLAASYFEKACQLGHVKACELFGYCLEVGVGVGRDPVAAAGAYEKACAGDDAEACSSLGALYDPEGDEPGGRLPADPAKAAALYSRGCGGGSAYGCARLGRLYEKAPGGLAKDEAKAARLYEAGCRGAIAEACLALAVLYEEGRGTAKDPKQAAHFFKRACELGKGTDCSLPANGE